MGITGNKDDQRFVLVGRDKLYQGRKTGGRNERLTVMEMGVVRQAFDRSMAAKRCDHEEDRHDHQQFHDRG